MRHVFCIPFLRGMRKTVFYFLLDPGPFRIEARNPPSLTNKTIPAPNLKTTSAKDHPVSLSAGGSCVSGILL
ncbi:hypothetical protein CH375_10405 [Leptospira ellisii]|uniref:Uncharacterized protein n=1 Tax=Leptospira ellisii TaxID=2023197 RepID=A0A2N0B707_9LEPT|nr:hypothetical protein CH379_13925 [Leptospira ellisii]PKA04532.1 hypothetical protein CH375_10405 [Leptospira ellisii]